MLWLPDFRIIQNDQKVYVQLMITIKKAVAVFIRFNNLIPLRNLGCHIGMTGCGYPVSELYRMIKKSMYT